MTSDDFFTHFAEPNLKYDLIFLDGLHTFEQTIRDLCSSLSHSHDDTIWLIDDVFPSDVFPAVPAQDDALKYRRLHGTRGTAWHGDVFKLVFAVHESFPNLSYRTVVGDGNPQTILVRRQRPKFEPLFNNLELISRLTYFDLLERQSALNATSEQEALEWLAEV